MNIAILGITGWIGSTIATEALNRGHTVIGLARDLNKITVNITDKRAFDLNREESLIEAVKDADVLVVSINGRSSGVQDIIATTAARLLAELPTTDVKRIIWVGGAGSLSYSPDSLVLEQAFFPEDYKAEALAHLNALNLFRQSDGTVEWTVISPAPEISTGQRTSEFRIGGDILQVDTQGFSTISVEDYSAAVLDEIENKQHRNTRISVAY